MSDAFVEQAKDQRSVLERLVKGLPFIRGYTDKETRRNADYRLRQLIASELDAARTALYNVQMELVNGGGLLFVDSVDRTVTRLQTLSDRIKNASYGYAGLFDTVGIEKDQLDALHRYDVNMLGSVATIETAVAALAQSLGDKSTIDPAVRQVDAAINELAATFDRRGQAIVSPDLLTGYAPPVKTIEGVDMGLFELNDEKQ
jgi:hypothetical protein